MKIVFPQTVWNDFTEHMLGENDIRNGDETLAFLLTSPNRGDHGSAMIVRRLLKPESADYLDRSRVGIRPTPEYVASVLSECRREGFGLLEAHTHPFDNSNHTSFSGTDWANDRSKMPKLAGFMSSGFQHATMVMGTKSFDAHYYDPERRSIEPIEHVAVVGAAMDAPVLQTFVPNSSVKRADKHPKVSERYDRQMRFIGDLGMERLRGALVGVVGLGGIGSFVAAELAHIGVQGISLVDPDKVDLSNLNRLVGAAANDIGRAKVEVVARYISDLAGVSTETSVVKAEVQNPRAVSALKTCDVLVGCLDNHGARLVLNQLAIQYVIPLVDGGSGIRTEPDFQYGGQVQVVTPGRGCLVCRGFIDATKAAFDLATPEHQAYERAHGYGTRELAPSVVTINGVIASLQASIVLRILAQDGIVPDVTVYQGNESRMFPARSHGKQNCGVCDPEALVAYGDLLEFLSSRDFSSTHASRPRPRPTQ